MEDESTILWAQIKACRHLASVATSTSVSLPLSPLPLPPRPYLVRPKLPLLMRNFMNFQKGGKFTDVTSYTRMHKEHTHTHTDMTATGANVTGRSRCNILNQTAETFFYNSISCSKLPLFSVSATFVLDISSCSYLQASSMKFSSSDCLVLPTRDTCRTGN